MIDNLQEFTEGFLREVDDELRRDQAIHVWKRYGRAIIAAVVGNVISMVLVVLSADRLRARRGVTPVEQLSPRKQRLRRMLDRFGVPGVSLLGQTVLPSQITSGALVAFGASTRGVIGWQVVSIILWGVAFGTLAVLGVDLVQNS